MDQLVSPHVRVWPPPAGLRMRHVVKGGAHYYMLFHKAGDDLDVQLELSAAGNCVMLDPSTGGCQPWNPQERLRLESHQCRVLRVRSAGVEISTGLPAK